MTVSGSDSLLWLRSIFRMPEVHWLISVDSICREVTPACAQQANFNLSGERMTLQAMPIGTGPFRRYVIQNMYNNQFWNGQRFVDDLEQALVFETAPAACEVIQQILREQYEKLPRHRCVCPVEIEVYGAAPPTKIARYLHQASVLHIATDQHGNGPRECLVLPTIHWGLLRRIRDDVLLREIPSDEWWASNGDK